MTEPMVYPDDIPNDLDDLDLGRTLKGLRPGLRLFGERYRLDRMLGRGGMGVVWLATDMELKGQVALKFLPDFVAADKVALSDLKEETRRSLELTHPNIVRTHTFCTGQDLAAIAMEYVDGETLSERRLDQAGKVFEAENGEFRKWMGQLCEALAYAHAKRQIVHRDLKPSNLMVNGEGDLKVTDFGIARSLNESRTRLSRTAAGSAGMVGGTLPYMSPQQAAGESPSISDDVYSLGATIYELLTGKPPFYSGEISEQVRSRIPPPMAERRVELQVENGAPIPASWEGVVADCLAKDPATRPASVAELAQRLGIGLDLPVAMEAPRGKATPDAGQRRRAGGGSRMGWRLFATAAALSFLAVGGWWFGHEEPKRSAAQEQVEAARAALTGGDLSGARRGLAAAESLHPAFGPVRALAEEVEAEVERQVGSALGKVDAAMAARDLLAARAAFREVLAVEPDHPRAASGLEGLMEVTGRVDLRISPTGARVEIGDGEVLAGAGLSGPLPLGTYGVRASHPGYQSHQEEIVLRNDQPFILEIALKRHRGTLIGESIPADLDAEVVCVRSEGADTRELNFTYSGRTPVKLDDLPTGDYRFTVRRAGWPDFEKVVTVNAGETATISHEFAEGTLRVESIPSLAEIWVGGRYMGSTPLSLVFPEGAVVLTAKKDGYVDQTVTKMVLPRRSETAAIMLAEIDPVDKFLDRVFQPRRFEMKAPVTSRMPANPSSAATEHIYEDLLVTVTKEQISGSYKETGSFRFPAGKKNKEGRNSGSYTIIRRFTASRKEVEDVLRQEMDPSKKGVFEPDGEEKIYEGIGFPGDLGPIEQGEKGIFLNFPEPQILVEDGLPPVLPSGNVSMNPAYRAMGAALGGFLVVDGASGRILRVESGVKGGGRSKLSMVESP